MFERAAPPPVDPAFIETIAFQEETLEREREAIEAALGRLTA